MEEVKIWLESLLKGLVSDPESLAVEASMDGMGALFIVRPNSKNGDVGKVIGIEGATIEAIRKITYAKGYMHSIRASIKLDVPERFRT